MRERSDLVEIVNSAKQIKKSFEDIGVLLELGEEAEDESMGDEAAGLCSTRPRRRYQRLRGDGHGE